MKKLILLASLAAGSQSVQAQSIAAGTISLGGSIGYFQNTEKSEFKAPNGDIYTDERAYSQFQFSPSAGYFVVDNLAVGLNMGYTATRDKNTRTGPRTTNPAALDARTTLRVGPYVQYYKMVTEQFGVLGTLGAGYQSSFSPFFVNSGGNSNAVVEAKAKGYYASLTPGVIFFPIPKFGISASIGGVGYDRVGVKRSDDIDGESQTESNFGTRFGFDQLQFGGTFYIGR